MVPGAQKIQRSQSARESDKVHRSKSRSAPVPLQLPVIGEEAEMREEKGEQTGECLMHGWAVWRTEERLEAGRGEENGGVRRREG